MDTKAPHLDMPPKAALTENMTQQSDALLVVNHDRTSSRFRMMCWVVGGVATMAMMVATILKHFDLGTVMFSVAFSIMFLFAIYYETTILVSAGAAIVAYKTGMYLRTGLKQKAVFVPWTDIVSITKQTASGTAMAWGATVHFIAVRLVQAAPYTNLGFSNLSNGSILLPAASLRGAPDAIISSLEDIRNKQATLQAI